MSAESAVPDVIENELPSFDLKGKTAFVTGSSRGIGRSIALALASAGADVAISCNTGGASAEEVCQIIRDMGRKAQFYAHNVALESEVESLCSEVKRDFGTIDVLVNNAGITRDKSFKKLTKDAWDEVITTDLTSVFLVTKQLIDEMADKGWGRIINMSSIVGEIGNFGQANYAAAKAGLIGLTKDSRPRICPQGRDRQCRGTRLHPYPHDRRNPRKSDGSRRGDDARRPYGQPRRYRGRRPLPGLTLGRFHHRRRPRYQRRTLDVRGSPPPSSWPGSPRMRGREKATDQEPCVHPDRPTVTDMINGIPATCASL